MEHKKKATNQKRRDMLERSQRGLASVWDILQNAFANYTFNGDTNQAAAISLYAILSLIPLFLLTILVINAIFGSHPQIQKDLMEMIQQVNPYFSEDLMAQLGKVQQKKTVLGWAGIISLIWFSAMIFGAIETAMNVIFRSGKKRHYVVSKLLAIAMIPLGWTIGIASVGITYVATILAKQPIFIGDYLLTLPFVHNALIRFFLPYLLTVAFFTIVYKVIPTKKISLWQAVTGAAIFSALMEIAKRFFAWYVASYTRYDVIFGSLQTVVILVIWVFYIALILLFCAELISSYQRRNLILLEKALLKPRKKLMRIDERLFRKFGQAFPEGSTIFSEGDTGKEMYYILAGRIRVEKNAGHVTKVLALLGPGEYFGEMAALLNAPRTASTKALEDSSLAIIDGDTFRSLLRESESVSLVMLKEFSNRINNTNMALEEVTQSWVKLAVIMYFLQEWPLPDYRDPMNDLAIITKKEPFEIQQVLKELGDQGIFHIHNDTIMAFFREPAWDLVKNQIFSRIEGQGEAILP